jgi:hypothetical protein
MHEHLPSLLIRGSSRFRDIGHFFRHFSRFAEVGLMWIRTLPGITSRTPVQEQEIKGRVKPPNRSAYLTPHQEVSGSAEEFLQSGHPDMAQGPLLRSKTTGCPKNEKLIISVHIPKTGGTTFVDILQKCAEEVLYLDYDYEGPSPIALFRRGKRLTAPFESIMNDLESLPGRSVIHGHFQAKKYVSTFPNAVYVTWLRDPVERIVSNYLYWQRSRLPGDRRWEQVNAQGISLEQFAQLKLARDNQQAYLYPLAVEDFDFVGITEEYDRSLELFRRLFCPDASFATIMRNRNPNRQGEFYDLEPGQRKKILKLNELDTHTYLDGVRRFRYLCNQVGI